MKKNMSGRNKLHKEFSKMLITKVDSETMISWIYKNIYKLLEELKSIDEELYFSLEKSYIEYYNYLKSKKLIWVETLFLNPTICEGFNFSFNQLYIGIVGRLTFFSMKLPKYYIYGDSRAWNFSYSNDMEVCQFIIVEEYNEYKILELKYENPEKIFVIYKKKKKKEIVNSEETVKYTEDIGSKIEEYKRNIDREYEEECSDNCQKWILEQRLDSYRIVEDTRENWKANIDYSKLLVTRKEMGTLKDIEEREVNLYDIGLSVSKFKSMLKLSIPREIYPKDEMVIRDYVMKVIAEVDDVLFEVYKTPRIEYMIVYNLSIDKRININILINREEEEDVYKSVYKEKWNKIIGAEVTSDTVECVRLSNPKEVFDSFLTVCFDPNYSREVELKIGLPLIIMIVKNARE